MRIGLFGYPGDSLREAAESGLRALGHQIVGQIPGAWAASTALRDLGAVVVCGFRGACREAARFYGAQEGVEVILIDLPHLLREDEAGYRRVTPPDLSYLPEFDGKAPRDRLKALGIKPQTRKRVKGQHVLILGQRGGDPTHGMSRREIQAWAERSIETLRSLTDSKIVWRPHPLEVFPVHAADGYSDPGKESLEEAFDGSWLVVTHSSSAGLKALIAGFPVIATGEPPYKDLTYDFGEFKNLAPPDAEALEDLLARVAYTQWSEAEIATGEPFADLLPDEGSVPRTKSESEEIEALVKIEGIGEKTGERLFAAGITSRRLWDHDVTEAEVMAVGLGQAQESAVRVAAGLTVPEPELTDSTEPEDADGADGGGD